MSPRPGGGSRRLAHHKNEWEAHAQEGVGLYNLLFFNNLRGYDWPGTPIGRGASVVLYSLVALDPQGSNHYALSAET